MQLLPNLKRVPERYIHLVWDLLQLNLEQKKRDPFLLEYYKYGVFAKRYTTEELEQMSKELPVVKAIKDMNQRNILFCKSEENSISIIFGFWRPVLQEGDGYYPV